MTAGGRLVLVVGPSGAGKDSLIRHARASLADDPAFVFPRRIVTRAPSADENNVHLDPSGFEILARDGGLLVHWSAHGLRYGLPSGVADEVAAGRTVVCNVSRTVVGALRARLPGRVAVLMISASRETLRTRLAARGRPDDGALDDRIARSDGIGDVLADQTIANDGSLDEACAAILSALRRLRAPVGHGGSSRPDPDVPPATGTPSETRRR